MKLYFLDGFSKKNSNIKFRQNLFIGSRVVPCGLTNGQTETDGWTDMSKLTVAFRKDSTKRSEGGSPKIKERMLQFKGSGVVYVIDYGYCVCLRNAAVNKDQESYVYLWKRNYK